MKSACFLSVCLRLFSPEASTAFYSLKAVVLCCTKLCQIVCVAVSYVCIQPNDIPGVTPSLAKDSEGPTKASLSTGEAVRAEKNG